jgi:Ca2+/Na+ antiporter
MVASKALGYVAFGGLLILFPFVKYADPPISTWAGLLLILILAAWVVYTIYLKVTLPKPRLDEIDVEMESAASRIPRFPGERIIWIIWWTILAIAAVAFAYEWIAGAA